MKTLIRLIAPICAWAVLFSTAVAVDTQDTLMLANPAISKTHIAFSYDGDLWTAKRDGSEVRRLTTHIGSETNPVFSPDGKRLAFSISMTATPTSTWYRSKVECHGD